MVRDTVGFFLALGVVVVTIIACQPRYRYAEAPPPETLPKATAVVTVDGCVVYKFEDHTHIIYVARSYLGGDCGDLAVAPR